MPTSFLEETSPQSSLVSIKWEDRSSCLEIGKEVKHRTLNNFPGQFNNNCKELISLKINHPIFIQQMFQPT